jgi:hypothetical protein
VNTLRTALFWLGCLLVFLLTAAASCFLRAKHRSVPDLKSEYAYLYAGNLERYSFLQYNQASPEEGRAALLQYLKLLQRIKDEHINFPRSLSIAISVSRIFACIASNRLWAMAQWRTAIWCPLRGSFRP